MKRGILLIIVGCILLIDGGMRLVLAGLAGLSGIILAIPCFYFGIRFIQKKRIVNGEKEMLNKLNDNWVSEEEKNEIRVELRKRGLKI